MPGRTSLHLPALSATVLRPAFLPSSPKCSTDSSGLPDPLPPSDDPDWGQPCSPCDPSWRSQTGNSDSVVGEQNGKEQSFLPPVIVSHRSSPSRVRSAAPKNRARP